MMQSNVNLLPASAVSRYRRKLTSQQWFKVGLSALAIAAIGIFACQSVLLQQRRTLRHIEATNAKPIAVRNANRELKITLNKMKRWNQQQLQLRSVCSPLPVLELLTKTKRQLDGALEVNSFEYVEQPTAKQNGSVTITMKTDNPSNSAKIMQSFRDSDLFAQVKLQSSIDTLKSGEDTDLKFSVRCEF